MTAYNYDKVFNSIGNVVSMVADKSLAAKYAVDALTAYMERGKRVNHLTRGIAVLDATKNPKYIPAFVKAAQALNIRGKLNAKGLVIGTDKSKSADLAETVAEFTAAIALIDGAAGKTDSEKFHANVKRITTGMHKLAPSIALLEAGTDEFNELYEATLEVAKALAEVKQAAVKQLEAA